MRTENHNTVISFCNSLLFALSFTLYFSMCQNCLAKASELIIQQPNINVILDEDDPLMEFIDYVLPKDQTTLFENTTRQTDCGKPPFEALPLKEVINKGNNVKLSILYDNQKYSRPIYAPAWKDFYYRGWLYMPTKISEARHKIFIYPIGASSAFDFKGSLGFNEKVDYDSHKNINLLIYNFNVKSVKLYENQIALIGEPSRTGASVISLTQDELLPKEVNEKLFLIQLSTPEGYEEDFIYSNAVKSDYLKKSIEDNSIKTTAPLNKKDSLN